MCEGGGPPIKNKIFIVLYLQRTGSRVRKQLLPKEIFRKDFFGEVVTSDRACYNLSINSMKGIAMTQTTTDLDARIEEAIDKAIESFWGSVVQSFPESEGGDFDPMYEGVMYQQATQWLEHWLTLNSPLLDDRK